MKKEYMQPTAEAVDVVAENMLAMSFVDDETDIFGTAPNRRGRWGNLWAKEN